MTKNSDIYPVMTDTPIRKYSMKTCQISGKRFKATSDNFYVNENSNDGLHPYHKKFDNFRRVNNCSVENVRNLVTLINN